MATITTTGNLLSVRLTRREKVAAGRGDLRVPLAAIRDVHVDPDALVAALMRTLGTEAPGRAKFGIWRGRGRREFIVARRGLPAVCVTLDGGRFNQVIISTADAEAIADEIRASSPRLRKTAVR